MAEESTDSVVKGKSHQASMTKRPMLKRLIGALTVIIIGYLVYPVIFSDVKPERHVDRTSQIPIDKQRIGDSRRDESIRQQGNENVKNIVITQSQLDKELDQHRQKLKEQNQRHEQELEKALQSVAADSAIDNSDLEPSPTAQAPKASAEAEPPLNTLPRAWIIQVVSFTEEEKSIKVRDALIDNGYKAFIKKVELTESIRYRVLVGPYINPNNSKRDKQAISKLIATRPVILNY